MSKINKNLMVIGILVLSLSGCGGGGGGGDGGAAPAPTATATVSTTTATEAEKASAAAAAGSDGADGLSMSLSGVKGFGVKKGLGLNLLAADSGTMLKMMDADNTTLPAFGGGDPLVSTIVTDPNGGLVVVFSYPQRILNPKPASKAVRDSEHAYVDANGVYHTARFNQRNRIWVDCQIATISAIDNKVFCANTETLVGGLENSLDTAWYLNQDGYELGIDPVGGLFLNMYRSSTSNLDAYGQTSPNSVMTNYSSLKYRNPTGVMSDLVTVEIGVDSPVSRFWPSKTTNGEVLFITGANKIGVATAGGATVSQTLSCSIVAVISNTDASFTFSCHNSRVIYNISQAGVITTVTTLGYDTRGFISYNNIIYAMHANLLSPVSGGSDLTLSKTFTGVFPFGASKALLTDGTDSVVYNFATSTEVRTFAGLVPTRVDVKGNTAAVVTADGTSSTIDMSNFNLVTISGVSFSQLQVLSK